ncbi:MAG: hypothetical protein RH862_00760 [Leptospiraceae bacterium]
MSSRPWLRVRKLIVWPDYRDDSITVQPSSSFHENSDYYSLILRRLAGLIVVAGSVLSMTSCHWIFGEPTMDPCDPAHNYYEGDRHYISRDYVQEDGTLDRHKMLDAMKPGHGRCADPEEILRKSRDPSHTHSETTPARGDDEIKFPDADLK